MQSIRNFYHNPELSESSAKATFEIELPMANYIEDIEIDDELNWEYGKRDIAKAETKAETLIMKQLNLPVFPLSIDLKAEFKEFRRNVSVYEITISGQNQSFLNALKNSNL